MLPDKGAHLQSMMSVMSDTTPAATSVAESNSAAGVEFDVIRSTQPTGAEEIATIRANPGFGNYFTDHMVVIDWSEGTGWHDARVEPYASLTLDPATSVFHYGQAIFEGLKVYRQPDGSTATFRPDRNAKRFRDSARRIAMPELPEELFLESLRQLIAVDEQWVPETGGEEALYLRPFMISREVGLGVHPSNSYTYYLIASPVSAYFKGGVTPVSVWLSTEYVRAVRGGTGAAKFAGNYAASLVAQAAAQEKGCDQVVWLDAIEQRYVEEMGGMNLCFVFGEGDDATLVTPELTGSLLPGVTRASLLELAASLGYGVEERKITTDEWRTAAESGELTEVFACGTAAVITPVGTVKSKDGEFQINGAQAGPITLKLREHLTGIQRGSVEDTANWMFQLSSASN